MRDVKRIKPFMNELEIIWKTKCPDWRFGQLISNALNTSDIDPFFLEEDAMLKLLIDYFGKEY